MSSVVLTLLSALPTSAFSDDAVLEEAKTLLKSGRADAAEAIYQKYLKTTPNAWPVRLSLAEIALRRGDYTTSQSILENALTLNPTSPEAGAMLGELLMRRSDALAAVNNNGNTEYVRQAGEVLKRTRAANPDHPAVLTQSAEWELRQNDLTSAERDLQRALQKNPGYVPAFQGLIRFYLQTKDTRRANDIALHTLDLDPGNSQTHFLVARMLGMANQPAEAVRYALKSEKLDYGRMPERDAFLAMQYDKLGESEQALRYYQARLAGTSSDGGSWLRMGKINDKVEQGELDIHEIRAHRDTMGVRPDVLEGIRTKAREDSRAERIDVALEQWRRILSLQTEEGSATDEARGAIAGLRLMQRMLQPRQTPANIGPDVAAVQAIPSTASAIAIARNELDCVKIDWAAQGEITPELRKRLDTLSENADSAIAGEAAFLLDRLDRVQVRLDEVDGLSAEEYTILADRLLLDQELVFSAVFYQRAFEMNHNAGITAALNHIKAKQAQASMKVNEGNLLFNNRKYADALQKYLEARAIHRQSDAIQLRLGDTYEKLHQWNQAYQAYKTAVTLSPGLAGSPGFSKHLERLSHKVSEPKNPGKTSSSETDKSSE